MIMTKNKLVDKLNEFDNQDVVINVSRAGLQSIKEIKSVKLMEDDKENVILLEGSLKPCKSNSVLDFKDIIMKLINYADFSCSSNYVECGFYSFHDNENDIELEKELENLKKILGGK